MDDVLYGWRSVKAERFFDNTLDLLIPVITQKNHLEYALFVSHSATYSGTLWPDCVCIGPIKYYEAVDKVVDHSKNSYVGD